MTILDWLINWFEQNTSSDKQQLLNNINQNYFELGLIDSFEFIGLIDAIETEFAISFNNSDFMDRNFSTIADLAKLIEQRR